MFPVPAGCCYSTHYTLSLIQESVRWEYRYLILIHVTQSGRRVIGPKFVLQQDIDPKHTANAIKHYPQRKEQGVLKTMVWPPQGPDLNNMESAWDYMKRI